MSTELRSSGVQFPDTSVQTTALPVGTIGIWSGTIATIPAGWQLCNGTNGTPDMRNRFAVAAGSTYNIGDTGGFAAISLTTTQMREHNHTLSVSLSAAGDHTHSITTNTGGAHTHATGSPASSPVLRTGTPSLEQYLPGSTGASRSTPGAMGTAGNPHTHTISATVAGDHTHTVSVTLNNAGSGDPHNNMPPYYALAYIMKII